MHSWTGPTLVATNIASGINLFASGAPSGFVVAWIGSDNNVYASFSSTNGSSWIAPVPFTTDGSSNANNFNGFGFASVATVGNHCMFTWLDNSENILACSATIPGNGILNLTASQNSNNFGLQYELFNLLQWQKNPLSNIDGFYVYRDGKKIATLGPTIHTYEDHNRKKGVTTTYSVSSFDINGNESYLTSVTIL